MQLEYSIHPTNRVRIYNQNDIYSFRFQFLEIYSNEDFCKCYNRISSTHLTNLIFLVIGMLVEDACLLKSLMRDKIENRKVKRNKPKKSQC